MLDEMESYMELPHIARKAIESLGGVEAFRGLSPIERGEKLSKALSKYPVVCWVRFLRLDLRSFDLLSVGKAGDAIYITLSYLQRGTGRYDGMLGTWCLTIETRSKS